MKSVSSIFAKVLLFLSLTSTPIYQVSGSAPYNVSALEKFGYEDLDPIQIPAKSIEALKPEISEVTIEDLVQKDLRFKGKDFYLQTAILDKWYPENVIQKNATVILKSLYFPDLSIEISNFSKQQLSGTLDENAIHRILSGLINQYSKFDFRLLMEPTQIRPQGYFGNLLGKASFVIDFDYSISRDKRQRCHIVWVQWEEKVFSFNLKGLPDEVDSNIKSLNYLLHNLWAQKSN